MITKSSQLFTFFIEEEKKKLAEFSMPHMPTLGNAYEEITKQGIDKGFVIPKGLNLRVVSGFIKISEEMLPQQIDCMVVIGVGRQYGSTNQYIYDIDRVLCIFEVKKTLKKADYLDALEHLGSIRRKFSAHFEEKLKSGTFEPNISHARKTFAQITGKMAPEKYLGIHNLPKTEAILFYTLVQEQHAPVSIVHSYDGYKTEKGLRTAFIDLIEEHSKKSLHQFGVPNLPNLVTSNDFCLIKGNGHPYLAIRDKNSWVAIFSTRYNPARIILEIIWSKISSYCNISMPYGSDLDTEIVAPLLVAEPQEIGESIGWAYKSLEYKEKNLMRNELEVWQPVRVGAAEMSAINIMAFRGGYLELDSGMNEYLIRTHNCSLNDVVSNLIQTRIFAQEDNHLRPVSDVTHILTNDDESGYISSDRDRFDAWCKLNSISPNYMKIVLLE